jgi:hypothetical protein
MIDFQRRSMTGLLALLIGCLTLAAPGFAAEPAAQVTPASQQPPASAEQRDTKARNADPTMTVEIVGEDSFASSRGAQARILIKNNDGELSLCATKIEFFGPTRFEPLQYSVKPLETNKNYVLDCIGPSAMYPVLVPIKHTSQVFDSWLLSSGYKEPILATMGYEMWDMKRLNEWQWLPPEKQKEAAAPVAARIASATATGEYIYRTPMLGLIAGAIAGWALVAVVIGARAGGLHKIPWIAIVTAGIGSVILALLLRYGAGITLPVSVNVNDFFGAFIVGLLSHRFAAPLLGWLGLQDEQPAESQAHNVGKEAASSTASPGTEPSGSRIEQPTAS